MTRGPSNFAGFAIAAVAAVIALPAAMSACGGSQTPADPSFCEGRDGLICAPAGFSFAQAASAVTDYCAEVEGHCPAATIPPPGETVARLSQPEPGKLCLAGTLPADGGLALLNVRFAAVNEDATKVTKTFDADARGITQMTFLIDSPPPGPGVLVAAAITTSLGITPGQRPFNDGFMLMTPPLFAEELILRQPGPVVAPFAEFRQTFSGQSPTFDTTALHNIGIGVVGSDLDYDFCIRDFKFRDAAGNEVTP